MLAACNIDSATAINDQSRNEKETWSLAAGEQRALFQPEGSGRRYFDARLAGNVEIRGEPRSKTQG
jgi:hypothetical protein